MLSFRSLDQTRIRNYNKKEAIAEEISEIDRTFSIQRDFLIIKQISARVLKMKTGPAVRQDPVSRSVILAVF